MTTNFETLAADIEGRKAGLDADLTARAMSAIGERHPDLVPAGRTEEISVEALLHLADQLVPGWSILFRGKAQEPDGHWSCTIRETMSRDSDEFIGHGKAPDLTAALLAAILRVVSYRSRSSLQA